MSYPVRHGLRHPVGTGWRDPYAEIEALHRRLDQLFFGTPPTRTGDERAPEVELDETDDGWVVEAQMPGVPPDAVDVELDEHDLVIRGDAVARTGNGEDSSARRRYTYRLRLPGEVDTDRAEAELEHGVLTVSLPRSARAMTRKLPVVTGSRERSGAPGGGPVQDTDDSWSGFIPTTSPPSLEDTIEMSPVADQAYPSGTDPARDPVRAGGVPQADPGRPKQPTYPYEAVNRQSHPSETASPYDTTGPGPEQLEPAYFPEGTDGYAGAPYRTANYPQYGAGSQQYGGENVAAGSYPVVGQLPLSASEPSSAEPSQQPLPDLPPNDPPPAPGYPPNGQPPPYNGGHEPTERERRDHPI